MSRMQSMGALTRAGAGLLASSLALLLACGARVERPNIVLIVIDTLRADHLGCYGYARDTSPAIDRLAAGSTRFENAFTAAPWTLPAFASLLTSTPPWVHGAVNDYLAPRLEIPTLARTLHEAGYETAGFVSHIYTSRVYGFDAGFDVFDDFDLSADYAFDQGREPRAEEVVGKAMRWLSSREKAAPFFLLIHLFDPHWDYAAPEPFRARFDPEYAGPVDGSYGAISRFLHADSIPAPRDLEHMVALYDGEIAYTDAWLDTLFRSLEREGLWDRTAIVLTADHGEEFRDHGSMGHSFTFYDEVLRVPLLLRLPDRRGEGSVDARPVSLLDLFPTVAAVAGAKIPDGLRGRSLEAPAAPESDFLEAGTIREGRYGRAVLSGPRKLIWGGGGYRLYDRSADPHETDDLLDSGLAQGAPALRPLLDRMLGPDEEAGWHVLWMAPKPGGGNGCSGTIDPDGIVVDLVPLGGSDVRITATNNGILTFLSETDGGFRFRVAPSDRPVQFRLSVNGQEDRDLILVGHDGFHPPAAAFGLDPSSSPPGALAKPLSPPPAKPGFVVWKGEDLPLPPVIDLSKEETERLRSLGYLGEP